MHIIAITSPSGQTHHVRVSKPQLTLGRSALSDVVIPDQKASRSHLRLDFGDQGVLLEDLGSANGTLVNNQKVSSHRLSPADVVQIGAHTIRLVEREVELDFDRTRIDSLAEFDATMQATPFESEINDTSHARLAVTTRNRTWEVPLERDVAVIGRGSECDVIIASTKVSRKHAQVERVGDGFRVRDLGSANGTWLTGRRIEQEMLRDGDTFAVGDARCVFKGAFSSEELTVIDTPLQARGRRTVVIVPGLMGSNLYLGSEQVWPNVKLLLTNPDLFRYPGKVALEPRGLVQQVVVVPNLIKLDQYNRLTEYLSEGLGYESGKDMFEFAYEWRQDVRVSAQQLGAAIEHWGIRGPITIIAHSLGTLVSRYYVDCLGGSRRVERVVFLGGAHYGVPKSVVVLFQGPEFLPFGLFSEKMRGVLTTFPSAHQILPVYAAVKDQHGQTVDVLADNRWVPEEQKACHALAREFRQELPDRCGVSSVSIFGYGVKTVTNVTMKRKNDGRCMSLDFTAEETGDSAVPQVTSVLQGTEIHPVRQHHGALHTDKDVQMRLKLELTR